MTIQVNMRGILESGMKIVLNDDAAFGFFIEKDGSLYELDMCLLKVEISSKEERKTKGIYSSCYNDAMDELHGTGFDHVSIYASDSMIVVGDVDEHAKSLQAPLIAALQDKESSAARKVLS